MAAALKHEDASASLKGKTEGEMDKHENQNEHQGRRTDS
jgi:hypothetical protein